MRLTFFYKKLVHEKVGVEESKHVLEVEGWKLSYSETCDFFYPSPSSPELIWAGKTSVGTSYPCPNSVLLVKPRDIILERIPCVLA